MPGGLTGRRTSSPHHLARLTNPGKPWGRTAQEGIHPAHTKWPWWLPQVGQQMMVAFWGFGSQEHQERPPELIGHSSSARGWSEEVWFPSPTSLSHTRGPVIPTWSEESQSSLGPACLDGPSPPLPLESLRGAQKDTWYPKAASHQPQTPPPHCQTRMDTDVPDSHHLGAEPKSRQKGPHFCTPHTAPRSRCPHPKAPERLTSSF